MLKRKYDSRDQIPEQYVDLFEEKDGVWVLTGVEGVKTQDDVDRVQEALRKERGLRRDAESELKSYKKLGDIDDVTEKLDRLPELEAAADGKADDEKIQELAEKRAQRQIAPLQRELDQLKETNSELESKVTEFEAANRNRMIDDAARQAASEMKVQDSAVEDVLMYARANFTVDDDGTVLTKEGSLPPKEWLSDLQEKKPHWWPPSQGGGAAGAAGAGGAAGNPLKGDSPNFTEFSRVAKTDPQKAIRWAEEAGHKDIAESIRQG